MGVSISLMSTGLVGAMQLTHAIVPPTPGPLAAAALVGADIGKVIVFGTVACLVGALAGWVWGQYVVGPRVKTPPSDEFAGKTFLNGEDGDKFPGTLSSYAPIAIPILLISSQSVAKLVLEEGSVLLDVLSYIGWPVVALSIGVWLAFRNIKSKEDRVKAKDQWVEDGLRVSAMILVVTGLGGSLSAILKGTPAVTTIAEFFVENGLPSIILPFIIGVVGNMITGSTTVGVITAGSLVAPMLQTLNLSPEAAMLSGASGSVIIKYVNSSYFWVCTSLTKLKVSDAIMSYGGVTLVGGVFSFLTVCVMWALGLV
jgi:GntP family gluconate:H+ symporter